MSHKLSTTSAFLPPCRGKARMGVEVWRNASTLTLTLSLQGRGDLFPVAQKGF